MQRSEHGVVRGHDEELLHATSEMLRCVRPRVEQTIGCEAALPEIWILNDPIAVEGGAHYIVGDNRCYIVMAPVGPDWIEYFLAHELAHWYSDACGMDLPIVVEEGYADLVAMEAAPGCAEDVRFMRSVGFSSPKWTRPEALRLTRDAWTDLEPISDLETRAIGFSIVAERGLDGIARLRAQARARGLDRVPPEWFLDDGADASGQR